MNVVYSKFKKTVFCTYSRSIYQQNTQLQRQTPRRSRGVSELFARRPEECSHLLFDKKNGCELKRLNTCKLLFANGKRDHLLKKENSNNVFKKNQQYFSPLKYRSMKIDHCGVTSGDKDSNKGNQRCLRRWLNTWADLQDVFVQIFYPF